MKILIFSKLQETNSFLLNCQMSVENQKEEIPELDWVQLRDDLETNYKTEGGLEKIIRKNKENPFVPIGCLATVCALTYGLVSFRRGDRQMSQYMMRARIAAQGFTIIAFVVGVGLVSANTSKKAVTK